MFVAPPIYVPMDADSEVIHAKQAEMQKALERVHDEAESWFSLSAVEQDRLREEWSDRRLVTGRQENSRPPSAVVAGEG
jgi:hypothetical protein